MYTVCSLNSISGYLKELITSFSILTYLIQKEKFFLLKLKVQVGINEIGDVKVFD